ncbi:hypothetical protein A2819_03130 [Candidatus Azambacteria bacterium RIFCSPHIGHO2_01_FULL_40_24]|uniref:Uncharacterized protein n=1 Tax=Candidatus Azambacteria bacterium RIFCSPHIGHO2_01_FULL_40_24 TaxID=1797301 RepID=A0A1F5B284_9BACT|nr:MAG: hypothetical protein A2819_03130 [Candidatus Azambacteria bacterium RIFCSPHIGHO2_01_FULL_40_24]
MAIAEKLAKKEAALKEKLTKKSQEAEGNETVEIDSMEWLTLFLGAGYIDLLFIILTIIGLIPIVGQIIYVIFDPILNIVATGIFWFYLQHKGLGHYWWLAFGGGLANLIPVVNWIGWIIAVLILYFLVKAEKIPFAGEAIEKASKAASKVPIK